MDLAVLGEQDPLGTNHHAGVVGLAFLPSFLAFFGNRAADEEDVVGFGHIEEHGEGGTGGEVDVSRRAAGGRNGLGEDGEGGCGVGAVPALWFLFWVGCV